MYLVRGSLTLTLGTLTLLDPSPEQWAAMRPGDVIGVVPPRSKTDQWGEVHCPYPCSLVYDDTPLNAAKRLRDAELRSPCRGDERQWRPLFATAQGKPLNHSSMDRLLFAVLSCTIGALRAKLYSWHSFRVGLACALRAAGCPPATTQLICRWVCEESLKVYYLKGTSEHVQWIEKADKVTVDAVRAQNHPSPAQVNTHNALQQECETP